jgi:hypothetical protein
MLRRVREIAGMRMHATDGDIGNVHDVYLDDLGQSGARRRCGAHLATAGTPTRCVVHSQPWSVNHSP